MGILFGAPFMKVRIWYKWIGLNALAIVGHKFCDDRMTANVFWNGVDLTL